MKNNSDITPNIALDTLVDKFQDLLQSPFFITFIALIFLDILTGYAKAFKTKRFDSKIGTNGLLRHTVVIFSVILVGVMARAVEYEMVSVAYCSFHILNYAGSFLENCDVIGIPMPDWVRSGINQLKKENDKKVNSLVKAAELVVKENEKN